MSTDARVIFTTTPLKTVTNIGAKEKPDTTVIDGLVYEAWAVEDWTGFGLIADHFRVVFIRQFQDTGGSL